MMLRDTGNKIRALTSASALADHRRPDGTGKFLAAHKVIQRGLLAERAVALGIIALFGYGIAAGLVIVSKTRLAHPGRRSPARRSRTSTRTDRVVSELRVRACSIVINHS